MSKVFRHWTKAVEFLNEKIEQTRPIAGENIILTNNGNGIKIHGTPGGGGADDEYEGYFKVVSSENIFSVIDGANPEASVCGAVTVNNVNKQVAAINNQALSTGSWTIYIQAYQSAAMAPTIFSTSSFVPAPMRRRLAIVTVSESGGIYSSRVEQLYQGEGIAFSYDVYTGPFAITYIDGDSPSVNIAVGLVNVGSSTLTLDADDYSVNSGAEYNWYYIDLSWSGSAYSAEIIQTTGDIPDAAAQHMHIIIGSVRYVNGAPIVGQYLTNNYTVTERIV